MSEERAALAAFPFLFGNATVRLFAWRAIRAGGLMVVLLFLKSVVTIVRAAKRSGARVQIIQ
ncbi:MAG: hypothetical protein WCJ11_12710 [Methylococcaceae bacterium]